MSPLPDGLRSAVTTLAARPKVVLATDFDQGLTEGLTSGYSEFQLVLSLRWHYPIS